MTAPESDSGTPRPPRDIYGRRPVSQSRGKTHERIMAMQRADGTLPGAEGLLEDLPDGSIGSGMQRFLIDDVTPRSVTGRRAYERSLVLFARDLAENGPSLAAPATELTVSRLAAHLAWRVDTGMDNPAELVRCAVHLTRLADWLDEHESARIGPTAEELRELAARLSADLQG